MIGRSIRRAALLSLLALTGCEGYGVLVPVERGERLRSGLYSYAAWSDHDGRWPAWRGYLDLRVGSDGVIRGSYRLPRQCTDAYGYEADCIGRVGGRVYRDGTFRFGFDEGWLSHTGEVLYGGEAEGRWETHLLGYSDHGVFQLYLD